MAKFLKASLILIVFTCMALMGGGPQALADQSKVVLVGGGQAYKPLDDFVLETEMVTIAGDSWFVDSGKTASGDGKSWDYAVITLNEAIDLCTADNGDVIHVAPGHAETIDAATDVIPDIAGITVIGYGVGAQRPTFSWADSTDATFPVSGADFVLKNMIFDGSSTASDTPDDMFTVTAAGFQLIGCRIVTGDSTEAATLVITGNADADRMKVINCHFTGSTDTGTTAAINFSAGATDIEIAYCVFKGDYASAAIASSSAILEVNIHHNYIYNFQDDDHAIEISSNTATGVIAYNHVITDAYITAIDSGGLDVIETYWSNDEVDDVMATAVWTHEDGAVLWSATELAALEGEAIDALESFTLDELMDDAITTGIDTALDDNSVMAYLLTTSAATNFDRTTMSLQAIGALVTLAAQEAEAVDALESFELDELLDDSVTTGLATAVDNTSVVGYLMASADMTNYDRTTDSLEAIGSLVTLAAQEGEAVDALESFELDEFLDVAVTTSLPTAVDDASVMGYLFATSVVTNYDRTTDSLQGIRENQDTGTAFGAGVLLDKLLLDATADTADPVDIVATEVADDSVMAQVMTMDGDASSFERVTDSLEALAQAYETILGAAGDIYYVDSVTGTDTAVSTGFGKSWAAPFDTINYANSQCTANNADVILVAPGHVEALSTTQIDLAIAGTTIIGLGNGAARPKITYSNAADSVDVSSSNTTLIGLQFVPSVDSVLVGVDIETSMTDVTIMDCDFRVGEALNTDEFIIGVDIKASCVDITIKNNRFYTGQTDAECTDAIKMTGATKRVHIIDNHFDGNYSTAAITGDTTLSTEVLIAGNSMVVKDGEPGIQLLTASTGVIRDNVIESTGATVNTMIVADTCSWFNNMGVIVDGATGISIGAADDTQVQTNVTASLEADYLDELIVAAVATSMDTSVHDTSVLGYLMATSDMTNFDRTTDSLEAIGTDVVAIEVDTTDLQTMISRSATRTTDTLPQTTTETIFDVATGPVRILDLIGEVTTVLGGTATNLKVSINPTVGAASDMATNIAAASLLDGSFFTMTGAFGSILINTATAGEEGMSVPYLVPVGIITITTDADIVGSIAWHVRYEPMVPGATITANGP